jgi:hypothetical protein
VKYQDRFIHPAPAYGHRSAGRRLVSFDSTWRSCLWPTIQEPISQCLYEPL